MVCELPEGDGCWLLGPSVTLRFIPSRVYSSFLSHPLDKFLNLVFLHRFYQSTRPRIDNERISSTRLPLEPFQSQAHFTLESIFFSSTEDYYADFAVLTVRWSRVSNCEDDRKIYWIEHFPPLFNCANSGSFFAPYHRTLLHSSLISRWFSQFAHFDISRPRRLNKNQFFRKDNAPRVRGGRRRIESQERLSKGESHINNLDVKPRLNLYGALSSLVGIVKSFKLRKPERR